MNACAGDIHAGRWIFPLAQGPAKTCLALSSVILRFPYVWTPGKKIMQLHFHNILLWHVFFFNIYAELQATDKRFIMLVFECRGCSRMIFWDSHSAALF
jgi:hypothetical protein